MRDHFCSLSAGACKLLPDCAMACASPVQRWEAELSGTPLKAGEILMEVYVWVCIALLLKVTRKEREMDLEY